jgi:hypothetical protein
MKGWTTIICNGWQICEEADFEVQMFNLAPKFIRSTMLIFNTKPPISSAAVSGLSFLLFANFLQIYEKTSHFVFNYV